MCMGWWAMVLMEFKQKGKGQEELSRLDNIYAFAHVWAIAVVSWLQCAYLGVFVMVYISSIYI